MFRNKKYLKIRYNFNRTRKFTLKETKMRQVRALLVKCKRDPWQLKAPLRDNLNPEHTPLRGNQTQK